MFEHKKIAYEGSHTSLYKINRLILYEPHDDWAHAYFREREIKGWTREKKIRLFQDQNPRWLNLGYGLFHWSSSRFR